MSPVPRDRYMVNQIPQSGISVLLLLLLLVAVPAALGLGTVVMFRDAYGTRIVPGVESLGVGIGAYERKEATGQLQGIFQSYALTPLTLRYQNQEWKATPREIGLQFDVDSTVEAAFDVGRDGSVAERALQQWKLAREKTVEIPPVLAVDRARLDAYLQQLAKQIDRPTLDSNLLIQPGLKPQMTGSKSGRRLDVQQAGETIQQTLLSMASGPLDLPVEEVAPKVAEADLQAAKTQVEQMLSGPVVLKHQERTWTVEANALAGMLSLSKSGEKVSAKLDNTKLEAFLKEIAKEIDVEPQDARFEGAPGPLRPIRESRDGRRTDVKAAAESVQSQVATSNRTITLPVKVTAPAVSSADPGSLQIKELIQDVTTDYYGGAPARMWNIELAAKKLNGIVVMPGKTFSMNKEMGATTLAVGFKIGFGITTTGAGNEFATVPTVAGGICQVATTLFQSVFWAGFALEERVPHLYWIARYGQPPYGMKGLDATVDQVFDAQGRLINEVDLKFTNNTRTPILIQSRTDGKKLSFSLYGQKPNWKVEISEPKIEDVVKSDPADVNEEDPNEPVGSRIQTEVAQDGFRATVQRKVTAPGEEPRVLNLLSQYRPSRNVFQVGTKKPGQPTPTPTPSGTPAATPRPSGTPTAQPSR